MPDAPHHSNFFNSGTAPAPPRSSGASKVVKSSNSSIPPEHQRYFFPLVSESNLVALHFNHSKIIHCFALLDNPVIQHGHLCILGNHDPLNVGLMTLELLPDLSTSEPSIGSCEDPIRDGLVVSIRLPHFLGQLDDLGIDNLYPLILPVGKKLLHLFQLGLRLIVVVPETDALDANLHFLQASNEDPEVVHELWNSQEILFLA